jgi:hypothetical protein
MTTVRAWPRRGFEIYMSGYTEEAIVQHGVVNPGIVFLDKPFTSETLGAKIREVLDRYSPTGALWRSCSKQHRPVTRLGATF